MGRKWFENGILGHFSHFPGHFSPIFQVRPKSIFRPFSSLFRARGPKWLCTKSTGLQNFGHSHPPTKIIPKCPFGLPRMNFAKFLGSAFFLALLHFLIGSPSRKFSRHFLGETFGIPKSRFRGEMKMLCWAAVNHTIWGKLVYLQLELFCLQLSFFTYSPLRPLLDALSHCKQKSSNCK